MKFWLKNILSLWSWCLTPDHKLRKFLSLELYFKYLELYLTHCFDKLLIWTIWTIWTFENIIWILINYQNYCKSYACLKCWLKNILSLWSWGPVSCTILRTFNSYLASLWISVVFTHWGWIAFVSWSIEKNSLWNSISTVFYFIAVEIDGFCKFIFLQSINKSLQNIFYLYLPLK